MVKIEAFIRPQDLEEVKAVIDKNCLNGMSFSQVMGCGNQKGWKEYVRGTEIDYNFLQKIKIEMVVLDEQAEEVIDAIVKICNSGEIGDGKIFIYDVKDAVRIRTKERGENAVK